AQRGQIRALQAQTQAEEARVRQLEAEQARWQDPAYVAAQARQRLHFVLPGETGYVVLDPPVPERAPVPGEPVLPAPSTPRPWYATVWGSLAAAGR
ncbi:MAG: septum formation initiator family protein, partial [Actinomycetota bacterium]